MKELAGLALDARDFDAAAAALVRLRELRPTDSWTLRQLGVIPLPAPTTP